MRTAAVQGSLWNRSQRLLIKTGRVRGVAGSLGRYVGRRIGCPMSCGYRLVINDPMEYVQRYVLACGVYEPSIAAVFEAVLGVGVFRVPQISGSALILIGNLVAELRRRDA